MISYYRLAKFCAACILNLLLSGCVSWSIGTGVIHNHGLSAAIEHKAGAGTMQYRLSRQGAMLSWSYTFAITDRLSYSVGPAVAESTSQLRCNFPLLQNFSLLQNRSPNVRESITSALSFSHASCYGDDSGLNWLELRFLKWAKNLLSVCVESTRVNLITCAGKRARIWKTLKISHFSSACNSLGKS